MINDSLMIGCLTIINVQMLHKPATLFIIDDHNERQYSPSASSNGNPLRHQALDVLTGTMGFGSSNPSLELCTVSSLGGINEGIGI